MARGTLQIGSLYMGIFGSMVSGGVYDPRFSAYCAHTLRRNSVRMREILSIEVWNRGTRIRKAVNVVSRRMAEDPMNSRKMVRMDHCLPGKGGC